MTKIYRASDKRLRDQIGKLITDLQTAQAGAVLESDYNANTILAANADDTPLPLTVAEQTLVGRITGGDIDDLSIAQVRTLLSIVDNATHTGEVTGATALTLDKTALTNRTAVLPASSDLVLISDASDTDALKKTAFYNLGGVYRPGLMYYDNATAYYSKTGVTVAGNKMTWVGRFLVDGNGSVIDQRLITVSDGTTRLSVTILENDHATVSARNKLQMVVQNSGGTNVAVITSLNTVTGNGYRTCFLEYDGDAGTATMIINGAVEKDTGSVLHVLTTGTLETGNMTIHVGASIVPDLWAGVAMGYFGYKDTAGLDWTDFMDANGAPTGVSEHPSWPNWGGQPGIWNPHGQLERNLGTFGDFTRNGKLLPSSESFSSATGWDAPVAGQFTPVIWDDSSSSSEGQTYTIQLGYYRKIGDMVNFWIDVAINSLGTLTTTQVARIGNLPFPCSSAINCPIYCGFAASLAITAGNTVSGYVAAGGSRIVLTKWSEAAGITNLTLAELSSGGRVIVSGSYLL